MNISLAYISKNSIIAILAIILIMGGVILYLIRAKKSGRKCIGCPDSNTCKLKNYRESLKEAYKCCCCKDDDKFDGGL